MQFSTSKQRPAIAMIELIFALVIMGITLISAPMLISTSSKSSFVALQQESIAAAVSQMGMIMTAEWDNIDTNSTLGEPVLRTDSTVFNQCNGVALRPIGVTSSTGRYCLGLDGSGPYSASATLGTDGTLGESLSYDDVDDYDGQTYKLNIYASDSYATHLGDYIDQNISILSNVYYGDDTPRNSSDAAGSYGQTTTFANPFRHSNPTIGTTNIKLIQVKLTSSNPESELSNKDIKLSAFMCNIGAPNKQPNIISNKDSL